MQMHEILQLLLSGRTLSAVQTEEMMSTVISGGADDVQAGAMLGALRGRGETADELTGAARAILARCTTIDCPDGAIDVCGTGGDGSGSFNISTTVALVVAGAGVRVAKHGNRAVSSRCGSADVLEQLGVGVDTGRERASELLDKVGFAFLLAPAFHSA